MKKKLLALAVVALMFLPTLAFAGSATDAALGLGAFAVLNQILAGTGVFGGLLGAPPPVAQPVVVAPPPVVVAAPPPVVVAPPPPVVVAPPPVIVAGPPPVFVAPPRGIYRPPVRVYHAPRRPVVVRGWCPPGHGGCY